ncbi:TonB-dependent receptor [Nitrospirillum sp. BR 11752]|uniref:TonB-dependent receptor n=1 Tax=Nitrospirillum sp. BR 11752 TaxID=3104293 RepID=UPI002E9B1F82|nr:TonB-dependent receptor [Nitrospirillum sp. BR 11752]
MKASLVRAVIGRIMTGGIMIGGALPGGMALAEGQEGGAGGIPEIIVTAQRREQSVQDVGLSVSVLSAADLAAHHVTSVNDLQNVTPGLEVTNAFGGGQPQFRIRGVGFNDYASNNTPTVGVYVDEVAYPLPIMTQGLVYDVDRVEVLRGPQGVLYGRNTTGGAINILTANPTDTASAGITGDYGSYGAAKVEAYVSGPVSDTVKVRLSAMTQQGGAWQTNRVTGQDLGNANRTAARAKIAWAATPDTDATLNLHYGRDLSDGSGGYLFNPVVQPGVGTLPADTDPSKTGWSLSPAFAKLIGADPTAKPFRNNTSGGADLTVTHRFEDVTLTSITAWEALNRKEFNDWDATAYRDADEYFNSRAQDVSQELRLASSGPGRLQWVGGLYYSHETLREAFLSDFTDVYGFIANTRYAQTAESISGFGQADYAVTDRLKLVLGLREEHEDRTLRTFSTSTIPDTSLGVSADKVPTGFTQTTGKAGVEFKLDDAALLYANVSRGVKSGGFTAYNTLALSGLTPFRPEVLWAYEAGVKSDLADHTVRLNASAYYYDYHNQQVQSVIIDPTFGAIGKIVNAPRSEIYGAELEVQWAPAHTGLRVTQALGLSHGEFTEFNAVNTAASLATCYPCRAIYTDQAGGDLGFPRITYNGGASYDWTLSGYTVKAEADYSYRSSERSLLGSRYNVAGYWLVNAAVTLAPERGPWTATVYGQNILDRRYDLLRNFFTNADIAIPGRPATWGVRLSYQY